MDVIGWFDGDPVIRWQVLPASEAARRAIPLIAQHGRWSIPWLRSST